jgi:tetratricopeptide (TPR) repeat protein
MKVLLVPASLMLLWSGDSTPPAPDLAKSYYHFTRAKMLSISKQHAEAVEEYKKAIAFDPASSELRVRFARTLWESGQVRDAVTECQKASEVNPADPEPHFWLGQIYYAYSGQTQKPEETPLLEKAQREFEKVVELDPRHGQALDRLGRVYFLRQEWRKAADALARLSDLNPNYPDAFHIRAYCLLQLGAPDEAIAALERSLKFQPGHVDNLKLLGDLYAQRREFDKAVEILTKAADADPSNSELRISLARALRGARKYSDAAEVLEQVLKNGRSSQAEANLELAQVLAIMGRRREAVEKFRLALEGNDSEQLRPVILTQLAMVYHDLRESDKAVELLKEACKSDSGSLDSRLRLAYVLRSAGKHSEALQLVDELMAKHPKEVDVLIAQARVLAAAGQFERAIGLLNRYSQTFEDPEPFLLVASQLCIDEKKYGEAEKIIKRGLAKKPDSEEMQFQLAAVYERQEEYSRAEADFKKLLTENPEHAGVLNYLGYMLADRGVRLSEALGYLLKAVELEPYNGAYLDSLGWVYFRLERLDLSESYLKQAAQLNGDDTTILEHLGDLYRKLERYDEAGRYYKDSLALAKDQVDQKRVQHKLSGVKKVLAQQRD